METYEEAHARIQGIFGSIALEIRTGSKIHELNNQIREAKHAETKRVLTRMVAEQREALYQITENPRDKRLAENCYKAAEQGFREK